MVIRLEPRDICNFAFMVRALGDSWRQDYLFDSREERDWVLGWASESLVSWNGVESMMTNAMQRRGRNTYIARRLKAVY